MKLFWSYINRQGVQENDEFDSLADAMDAVSEDIDQAEYITFVADDEEGIEILRTVEYVEPKEYIQFDRLTYVCLGLRV